MLKKGEVRPLLLNQTISYYVLYALEMDQPQGYWIRGFLAKNGHSFTSAQINAALQRLRKDGLAEHRSGRWYRKWAEDMANHDLIEEKSLPTQDNQK